MSFPLRPSSGNWFGHSLPQFDELWQVDGSQTAQFYPLYEEVPYSKRLEVVPFDPQLYPEVNDPALGEEQEHPAKLHFLDDRKLAENSDTQAFISHHDELILISVRGTSEGWPDAWLDADAHQVPFEEGDGKVHKGFYQAAKVAYTFTVKYLEKFYSGQKLLICGHSLGGRWRCCWLKCCAAINNIRQTSCSTPTAPPSFLRQVMDNGHHSMVGSYIPGCWATLRRWQQAQEQRRPRVTFTEYQWVRANLENVKGQLHALRTKIERQSRAYANPQRDAQDIRDLEKEVDNLERTKARLEAPHQQAITLADVYGSHADQPEWVQESLLRWRAHPKNIAQEPLAMMPPPPVNDDAAIAAITGGYAVGMPFDLDIDSIV